MSWSDTDQKYQGTRIIFTDTEKSNWTWDPEAGPILLAPLLLASSRTLNFDQSRASVNAIIQVMEAAGLDAGVDGFRLDAIPLPVARRRRHQQREPSRDPMPSSRKLRVELDSYSKGKVLLAGGQSVARRTSRNISATATNARWAYHFPADAADLHGDRAGKTAFPITDILRQTPDIPTNCQWALFFPAQP